MAITVDEILEAARLRGYKWRKCAEDHWQIKGRSIVNVYRSAKRGVTVHQQWWLHGELARDIQQVLEAADAAPPSQHGRPQASGGMNMQSSDGPQKKDGYDGYSKPPEPPQGSRRTVFDDARKIYTELPPPDVPFDTPQAAALPPGPPAEPMSDDLPSGSDPKPLRVPPTPEFDRLLALQPEIDEFTRFLDFVSTQYGLRFCGSTNGRDVQKWVPSTLHIPQIVAAYRGVNVAKASAEREAALRVLQSGQTLVGK